MGFFEHLENRKSQFDRDVRNQCDKIDRGIDRYERNHPGEKDKVSDLRQKSSDLRNKHS